MLNTEIHALLVAEFKNQITRSVEYRFEALVRNFGPALKGVANSTSYRVWSETVRPCVDAKIVRGQVESYTLNPEKVARVADLTAAAFADAVIAKVDEKVGELDDGIAAYVGGASFTIRGKKNGHAVTIHQSQILNVSVRGKLFNQYPARIYVDGKFTSAAKFAKL